MARHRHRLAINFLPSMAEKSPVARVNHHIGATTAALTFTSRCIPSAAGTSSSRSSRPQNIAISRSVFEIRGFSGIYPMSGMRRIYGISHRPALWSWTGAGVGQVEIRMSRLQGALETCPADSKWPDFDRNLGATWSPPDFWQSRERGRIGQIGRNLELLLSLRAARAEAGSVSFCAREWVLICRLWTFIGLDAEGL